MKNILLASAVVFAFAAQGFAKDAATCQADIDVATKKHETEADAAKKAGIEEAIKAAKTAQSEGKFEDCVKALEAHK